MKMIHCADIHLDASMMTNLSPQQAKERNIELLETFQNMIAYGEQQQVDAILIAGDLFDTLEPAKYMKHVFLDLVREYERIDFFYLRGNHDRSVSFEEEEIPENLKLFGRQWKTYFCGGVCISGVECVGNSLCYEEKSLLLDKEAVNIVMLHGRTVEQGNSDNSEDQIPLGSLQHRNIDYLALGHIHDYQKERLDDRGLLCYSGCLEGRGYDECGQKGFVLLDIDEQEKKVVSSFVPFGKRQLYEIYVSVDGTMTSAQMVRIIEQTLESYEVQEKDFVKIILTGALDVECEKNMFYIRKKLEGRFYSLKIEDQTTYAVDYSDFILDETLKGDFVRMIQEADLPQRDKTEMIRLGILALTGEELAE